MAFVMFCEHQFCSVGPWDGFSKQAILPELFLQPDRHGHCEAVKAGWSEGEVGFEQSFEFGEWLFVKGDVVDLPGSQICL
jgi:hypothetical protein